MWVRVTSTSMVDHCLRSPSWLGWMKLLEIVWNWRCSPVIFLKSFPIILRRTIGQYNLGESNMALLGLGIIIMAEVLKWDSQCPKFMQALAISMNLQMQSSLLIIDFKWLQVNLSGPRADKLLYFSIMSMSFFLENGFYTVVVLSEISSRKQISTSLAWAKLNEL